MASPTREQVIGALDALLRAKVKGVKTFSRRIVMPAEIGSVKLPALTIYRLREHIENPGLATPALRHFNVWLILTIQNMDKSVAGDTIINPIMDSIDDALAPSGPGWATFGSQTLGGLVQQCKVEGDIHLEPGDTDPNGIGGAVIPLHILLP